MEGNHRSLKIFLAVFTGSLIGGLICRHFGFPFWFIGLPIGGLVGYLAYEPLAVLRAIPVAWRLACREIGLSGQFLRRNWLAGLIIFLVGEIILFWFLALIFISAGYIAQISRIGEIPLEALFCGSGIGFVIALLFYMVCYTEKAGYTIARRAFLYVLKYYNPLSFLFYTLPVHCYRATVNIIRDCWHHRRAPFIAGRFLGLFFWKLFLIIHSQERLLCGIDAAIGASLVYFLHYSPLIGALIGGLFGVVVDFEILSKRVLKVAPAKAHS